MQTQLDRGIKKTKTPSAHALGVFFTLLFAGGVQAQDCAPSSLAIAEAAQVKQVLDGDTLRLTDGRKVRLLGINAPELARDGRAAEPLAQEALLALKAWLGDGAVTLYYDRERRDHYDRLLAHVYRDSGSAEAILLQQGLAYHIAVPPNTTLADCLRLQESKGRSAGLGVWHQAVQQARHLKTTDSGFYVLQGTVVRVSEGRDIWLELDGPLVIKIARRDQAHFSPQQWRAWQGRQVEVRGWVINRGQAAAVKKRGFKPLLLPVRTSLMLQSL